MLISDWRSDVCSSDLLRERHDGERIGILGGRGAVIKRYRQRIAAGDRQRIKADAGGGRHELAVGVEAQLHRRSAARRRQFGPVHDQVDVPVVGGGRRIRSEEHTSELQSLMRISYAVFCLKKTKHKYLYSHSHHTKYKSTNKYII